MMLIYGTFSGPCFVPSPLREACSSTIKEWFSLASFDSTGFFSKKDLVGLLFSILSAAARLPASEDLELEAVCACNRFLEFEGCGPNFRK